MKTIDHYYIYIKLFVSALCWGGAFVAAKIAVQQLPPTLAAALRFTLAFGILLIILLVKEGKQAWVHPKDWRLLLSAALTGVVLYNIFFFTGMIYTSSINGSLIVATGPVLTTILAGPLLKERITKRQLWGLFLSVIGVVVIVSHGSWSILMELKLNRGDLIIACAVVCWSLYTIIGKAIVLRWSSLLSTTYACGLGALILWMVAWPQVTQVQWQFLEPDVILSLVFLAVFASALAFVFWYEGVGCVGASRAAVFQNLVPLFSAVFANLVLGERVQLFHGAGAVMIFCGVYWATRPQQTAAFNGQSSVLSRQGESSR